MPIVRGGVVSSRALVPPFFAEVRMAFYVLPGSVASSAHQGFGRLCCDGRIYHFLRVGDHHGRLPWSLFDQGKNVRLGGWCVAVVLLAACGFRGHFGNVLSRRGGAAGGDARQRAAGSFCVTSAHRRPANG